jgi:hypothetical protein
MRLMRRPDPDFWFYKAQSLSEKVYLMRFSTNLKKCLAGLMLGGAALWVAGCGESASTSKPSGSTSISTSPRLNSDGSVRGDGTTAGETGSSSEDAKTPAKDGDGEQAGSSTGGREVPLPADDKDEAK